MYCVGVMIDSLKNGSSMLAIFCASGRSAGLSTTCSAAVGAGEAVLDARRRGDERQAELALEPLLDDLHVQQTEEAAAESEPERAGRLGRVGDRRVVQLELLERLAEVLEVVAVDREQPGEHHRFRLAIPVERHGGTVGRRGDRLPRLRVADVLDAGDQVPDLTRAEFGDGCGHRHAGPDLDRFVVRARLHELQLRTRQETAVHDPHARHDTAVLVELGVEDQALQRGVRVTHRRRDPLDDRIEQVGHPFAGLGRHADDLLGRNAEHGLDLARVPVGIGRREIDLVQRRHDLEIVLQRQIAVGERLGLDALGGVDDEHDTLARRQAAADLVPEVDVAGRVDQVEDVALPGNAHVLGLDRDAPFALEVHRIEVLRPHVTGLDGAGDLEDPVGQRRLAVVDVRDDREVPDAIEVHGPTNATDDPGVARRWSARPAPIRFSGCST